MKLVSDIFERLPQVWVLLGLLFFSGGLYLGFDYSLAFVYLGVGVVCFLYGLLLFVFMQREGTRKSNIRPLLPPPEFPPPLPGNGGGLFGAPLAVTTSLAARSPSCNAPTTVEGCVLCEPSPAKKILLPATGV